MDELQELLVDMFHVGLKREDERGRRTRPRGPHVALHLLIRGEELDDVETTLLLQLTGERGEDTQSEGATPSEE